MNPLRALPILMALTVAAPMSCGGNCSDHRYDVTIGSVEFQAFQKSNNCDWKPSAIGLVPSRDKCPTDEQARDYIGRCKLPLIPEYGDHVNFAKLVEYRPERDECIYDQSVTECVR